MDGSAGAALLGLGVNLRETIGLYVPWLVLAPLFWDGNFSGEKFCTSLASCVVFVLLAFGWFGYWFITDAHYRWVWYGWRESMREESARHPVALANLRPYLMYYFISAPLVFLTLPFAPILEWRKRRLSPMLLLWLVAFCAEPACCFSTTAPLLTGVIS